VSIIYGNADWANVTPLAGWLCVLRVRLRCAVWRTIQEPKMMLAEGERLLHRAEGESPRGRGSPVCVGRSGRDAKKEGEGEREACYNGRWSIPPITGDWPTVCVGRREGREAKAKGTRVLTPGGTPNGTRLCTNNCFSGLCILWAPRHTRQEHQPSGRELPSPEGQATTRKLGNRIKTRHRVAGAGGSFREGMGI
jgi:hypothetical protein